MSTADLSAWVLSPFLLWVVFSDLLYRRIANLLIVLLLALWLANPLAVLLKIVDPNMALQAYWVTQGLSIAGAFAVLLVGMFLFAIGRVGGGDVKLMACVSLWVGYDNQLAFLVMTSLLGGVLALTLPLLNRAEEFLGHAWYSTFQRFNWPIAAPVALSASPPVGIPYGLAIAAGAFYTLLIHIHY